MGLIDGLSGKILKHNQIKKDGSFFLFGCSDKYNTGSFLNIYYKSLGVLYLNYCLYLYESINTPSYKKNIKNVNYEYMMKYMVSIISCEIFYIDKFKDLLNKSKFNIINFSETVSNDCRFSTSEKKMFITLAENYKNKNESLRSSIILGYTKHFYEEATQNDILVEENISIVITNSEIIKWFSIMYEELNK